MTKDELQVLQALFNASEQRMASVMDEKLAASDEAIERRFAASDEAIEKRFAASDEAIEKRLAANIEAIEKRLAANNEVLLREVNIVVENKYDEILKLLREDYTPVREKVAEFSDYPKIKRQVADHDRA